MPGFDMHIHTKASDGVLEVDEIMKLAEQSGLEGIAITDHDTVGSLDRALALSKENDFLVIPGIELSTEFAKKEVHILGYLFNYHLPWVTEKLEQLQRDRVTRILKMVDKLNQLGYDVDKREVQAIAGNGSIGRPHIAYVLRQKGYISSLQDAFQHLIGIGCPAYVPRFKLSPVEAVKFIREAKGVPVMAHPGLSQLDYLIPILRDEGLMGLEVYHPDHSYEEEERYLQLATKYKLIVTGGSDFHGYKEGSCFTLGSKTVPRDIWHTLHTVIQLEGRQI